MYLCIKFIMLQYVWKYVHKYCKKNLFESPVYQSGLRFFLQNSPRFLFFIFLFTPEVLFVIKIARYNVGYHEYACSQKNIVTILHVYEGRFCT